MPKIEYFYSERSKGRPHWQEVYIALKEKGITIHIEPKSCDYSVVLGGCFVNPIPLQGKKILAVNTQEWQAAKWEFMFRPILEEYYDKMINVTGCTPEETLELIKKTCVDS